MRLLGDLFGKRTERPSNANLNTFPRMAKYSAKLMKGRMKRDGNTRITWFLRGPKRRELVSMLLRYLAVSRTQKLYETKAVSEGVRHERKAAPFLGRDRLFQERPTRDRSL